MTFGEFKAYVATYINRDVDSFVRTAPTPVNILNVAINDAKRTAQRKHNFERLRTTGFIWTSAQGASFSRITTVPIASPEPVTRFQTLAPSTCPVLVANGGTVDANGIYYWNATTSRWELETNFDYWIDNGGPGPFRVFNGDPAVNDAVYSQTLTENANPWNGTWVAHTVGHADPVVTPFLSLPVKKINSCWQFSAGTNERIRQIDFIRSTDLKNVIPTLYDLNTEPQVNPVTFKNRAYVEGNKFYITGFSAPTQVLLDVYRILPGYTNDNETDFFISDLTDWMLFQTLLQLNAYLKETERIQVSKALLDSAWDTILQNDNEFAGNNDSANSLE